MAIAAERFKFLDYETNVAVTDFTEVETTDVLNVPSPGGGGISGVAESISKSSTLAGIKDLVKKAKDAAGTVKKGMEMVRQAKDVISSVKNLKNFSMDKVDKLAGMVLGPGSPQFSAYKGLADTVKGSIASAMSLESQLKGKIQMGQD